MNIEISDVTVVAVTLGLIVLAALRYGRVVRVRVSPTNLELDLDQRREELLSHQDH